MGEVVLTQTSRGLDFLVPGSATNQMLPSKTEPCSQNLKEVFMIQKMFPKGSTC